MEELPEGSKLGKASWELRRDDKGREVVTLEVSDPWGAAPPAYFTPNQLRDEEYVRQQFHQLIGKLLKGSTPQQHSFVALMTGVTDENLHPEVDTGNSVGKEAW